MSESQIRFLVESYYDIQKLRIETFNRIVAYVKSNIDKFSQEGLVAQRRNASQNEHEIHCGSASQKSPETQNISACSQDTTETLKSSANPSHEGLGTQSLNADSQGVPATHKNSASQDIGVSQYASAYKSQVGIETQNKNASQNKIETQKKYAIATRICEKGNEKE